MNVLWLVLKPVSWNLSLVCLACCLDIKPTKWEKKMKIKKYQKLIDCLNLYCRLSYAFHINYLYLLFTLQIIMIMTNDDYALWSSSSSSTSTSYTHHIYIKFLLNEKWKIELCFKVKKESPKLSVFKSTLLLYFVVLRLDESELI